MVFKRIWCSCCGHEGPRKIMGRAVTGTDTFTPEGHNPYSGRMYFRCPRCRTVLGIDSADALESITTNGYPIPSEVARQTRSQNVFLALGGMYIVFTLFVLATQLFL